MATEYNKPTPLNASAIQHIEWQQRAVDEIVSQFDPSAQRHLGCMLRGGTGLGKMYIKALAIRRLLEAGMLTPPEQSLNPFPVLWLCPKSVKTQTQRVLKDCGILHLVMVMSYGQLKNQDGTAMFLSYKTEMGPNGQPNIIPEWYPHMRPAMIVSDEMQVLKNPDSLQAKTVRYAPIDIKWLGASATPWQRVSDARATVERCGVVCHGYNALPCTRATSLALLREIASPKHPDKYSPSAVERLRNAIDPYIVELKGVRFKFPTQTKCETIRFRSSEQRQAYEFAYEEYLEECRKKGEDKSHGQVAFLVAMQKFQQKAELLRCDQIAERAVARVGEGKQVIIASNYINTLRSVWTHLVKVHGVDKRRIVFVVGGQTERERQQQVDMFQSGNADYILFTMRSGGVGISLHHDRVTTRPRHIILPPTWSAIDLVQALGRGHRLTSISATTQEVLWYGDTVEDKVKIVVERKVKCISKSVTAKEQFITMFEKASGDDIDKDKNDELNEAIEEGKEHGDNGIDEVTDDEGLTGEGLDSVADAASPSLQQNTLLYR